MAHAARVLRMGSINMYSYIGRGFGPCLLASCKGVSAAADLEHAVAVLQYVMHLSKRS